MTDSQATIAAMRELQAAILRELQAAGTQRDTARTLEQDAIARINAGIADGLAAGLGATELAKAAGIARSRVYQLKAQRDA